MTIEMTMFTILEVKCMSYNNKGLLISFHYIYSPIFVINHISSKWMNNDEGIFYKVEINVLLRITIIVLPQ